MSRVLARIRNVDNRADRRTDTSECVLCRKRVPAITVCCFGSLCEKHEEIWLGWLPCIGAGFAADGTASKSAYAEVANQTVCASNKSALVEVPISTLGTTIKVLVRHASIYALRRIGISTSKLFVVRRTAIIVAICHPGGSAPNNSARC